MSIAARLTPSLRRTFPKSVSSNCPTVGNKRSHSLAPTKHSTHTVTQQELHQLSPTRASRHNAPQSPPKEPGS